MRVDGLPKVVVEVAFFRLNLACSSWATCWEQDQWDELLKVVKSLPEVGIFPKVQAVPNY